GPGGSTALCVSGHSPALVRDGLRPSRAQSKSPSLAPPTKAAHSAAVNTRAGPAGCRELRTATWPSGRFATSTQLPPCGPLRRLLRHVTSGRSAAGIPLRMLIRLVLQLVDDRGEDPGRLARLGADDAEPLHSQQVTVHVRFLVEVKRTGEMLQVRDIRQVRLAEPQEAEPARRGMAAHADRGDLQREVLPAAQAEQVAELVTQDLDAPDRPPQRGLLDDGPQLEPPLGEPPLPFLAQDDMPLRIADRDVAHGEDGGRVLVRLQQAGDELAFVNADRG